MIAYCFTLIPRLREGPLCGATEASLEGSIGPQLLAEAEEIRNATRPVGRDVLEPEVAVEADRRGHLRQRVEQDLAVSGRPGERHCRAGERTACPGSATGRTHVEPLHLAGALLPERAHPHAAERLPIRAAGEEQ